MASTTNGDVQEQTSNPRSKFTFSHQWFEWLIPEWEEFTASFRTKKLRILEIGSFEGASTTWMLENLMSHPESVLTVVDTFKGSMEHFEGVHSLDGLHEFTTLEARFRANVDRCEQVGKLQIIKGTSEEALIRLRQEKSMFDFIYIDGSHVALDVIYDAVLCWRMLEMQGTMVFDDWSWKGYEEECYNPRPAIEAFLKCAAPELLCAETEAQMWVVKVPNYTAPTKVAAADVMHSEWVNKDLPTVKSFKIPNSK